MIHKRWMAGVASVGVLLAACSLPPAPPEKPGSGTQPVGEITQVGTAVITAAQVSIDPQGLWAQWKATNMPATPYDASGPPGPTGLPEHVLITFNGQDPAMVTSRDPVIYLIPVKAYEALWNAAGNPSVSRTMMAIYSSTVALQSPPPVGGMPALPFEQIPATNDLAVQQGRVPSNASSASKSGYRFVGRWEQSANPVTNQNLRYVYQGFTNDGAYLVAFFTPITTTALPDSVEGVPASEMDLVSTDSAAYMAEQAKALNALAPTDWQPAIDQLDAVVASLQVSGMQAYGLQGPTWQLVAQRNGSTTEALDQPKNYTVTFGDAGELAVQADCNRVAGTYTAEGGSVGSMRVQLGPSTLAACGPDSHADLLMNVLASAQNYKVLPGGTTLELIQPAGGTVLIFER